MPTVLITGASRGIGKGFADYYAAEGWRVIATARNPDGLAGEALPLDVTSDGSVTSLVDSLAGEPIDLLINNAGITGPRGSGVGNLDYDAWGEVLAVDAIAPIRVAAALADNVAKSERKLMVFISSMMGSIGQTHSSDSILYRSAKACLNQAVNVMSHDLKSRGIACVLFHPGWVRTDMGGAGAAIDVKTSIRGMTNVITRLGIKDNGRFINYDGFDIPW
jgi:NAD(P)-dependent dehydrogenase (short-subunit alcohol dehydrogenase family)